MPSTIAAAGNLVRRNHERTPCAIGATFVVRSDGRSGEATVVNIGLGGVRVDLPIEVVLPEDVELALSSPSPAGGGGSALVTVVGRVIWTLTGKKSGPYPTGLQFSAMDDPTRRRLYDLLASLPD